MMPGWSTRSVAHDRPHISAPFPHRGPHVRGTRAPPHTRSAADLDVRAVMAHHRLDGRAARATLASSHVARGASTKAHAPGHIPSHALVLGRGFRRILSWGWGLTAGPYRGTIAAPGIQSFVYWFGG